MVQVTEIPTENYPEMDVTQYDNDRARLYYTPNIYVKFNEVWYSNGIVNLVWENKIVSSFEAPRYVASRIAVAGTGELSIL